MIEKTLSEKSIKQRTDEMSFMWMLHSKVFVKCEEDDITNILSYWFNFAFDKEMVESDCNNDLIDHIRKQLLINAGVKYPTLINTEIWIKLKNSIVFED